jgi:tight adherence protein B
MPQIQLSTPMVFALIAFAGVFLLMLGISRIRRSAGGAEDFQARLAAYGVTTAGATTLPPSSGLRESLNRLFQPAADRMGRGDVKKGKPSVAEQLVRADLKLRTSEFFMIQVGSTVLFVLIAGLRFGFSLGSVIQLVIAGVIGYLIPARYVKYRIGARLRAFNNQLGDTLTLLSNAIKAGYSFAQAIDTVAKNAVPPIADEFGRAVREMNLGGSPDEALQNITKRVESPDFDLVATAYSIHRTVGGNLAEILDNIAYTIRERVRIKGEIATLTAQARASGTLITFLPIVLAVFMYFVTPTYFRPMFENFIGWILIAIGIFMIFIGNLIIRRVVAIEV